MRTSQILTVCLLFASLGLMTNSFLIQIPTENWKKCYRAEHSPDKTLQVKFGILRRQKNPCKLIFTVDVKDSQGKIQQNVHSDQYLCARASPGSPYVVKHTNFNTQYGGYYDICVQVQSNQNPGALVELFIGQKLNPVVYGQSQIPIPLVQSQQFMEIDLTAQAIKRSLIKSQVYAKDSRELGDRLDKKIDEMMSLNTTVTFIQILVLLSFGAFWIIFVGRSKRSSS